MGVGGQHHVPAALPPGKTRYPLYRRVGAPQGRSGRVLKISPPTGIRSPNRPARSESLYRLSYPGRLEICNYSKNNRPEGNDETKVFQICVLFNTADTLVFKVVNYNVCGQDKALAMNAVAIPKNRILSIADNIS